MKKKEKERKKRNKKVLFLTTFFSSVLLMAATYAWLSTALNVKINFFEMKVASDSGLFISLDGIDFSDSITISVDSVIHDLKEVYPNHTNFWSTGGLWPVSSNGIRNANSDKFDVFSGHLMRTTDRYADGTIKRVLNTMLEPQTAPSSAAAFIAFDIFLKNASGSPKSDNLYIDEKTKIEFEKEISDETRSEMAGLLNSIRVGIVKIGWVPHKTDVNTIQNIQCNNECEYLIYEPYSLEHSGPSINTAMTYGVDLIDGIYTPTYAIIGEGYHLNHISGYPGTGVPLDTAHFAYQNTINESDIVNPIFQIPNGIMKLRVYVWIEGQDIDSLEIFSNGAPINISIELLKDLAGYDV